MKNILILGGGTGGLISAKHFSEELAKDANIVLVDKKDKTEFRPSYLYVMMGYREPNQVSAPLSLIERKGVKFVNAEVKKIDVKNRYVETSAKRLEYDYLIIALGAETRPELVKGGPFLNPWELDGAIELRKLIKGFKKGNF